MKKILLGLLFLAVCTGTVCSQDVKLVSIGSQNMLIDQKDPLRYSILNVMDNSSNNVYAVENSKLTKGKNFISFYMDEPVKIDCISLEHGYFDSKYFEANNRLKKVKVIKKLNGEILSENIFSLENKMEAQKLNFRSDASCREIDIELLEIYPGSKWDDTVVSEISFYHNDKKLPVYFIHDSNALYQEYVHSFNYSLSSNNPGSCPVIKEDFQYGKAGAETYYYYKDAYLQRYVAAIHENMEETSSVVYHYKDSSAKEPFEKVESDQTGKTILRTKYTYENGKLVKEENSNYTRTYTYDNNNLVKIVQKALNRNKAHNETIEYSYKNNLIASEMITKYNSLHSIYEYIYDNNQLSKKICIYSCYDGVPENYYYTYDKEGRMISEYTMCSFSY